MYGQIGKPNLVVKYCNNNICVIRCSRDELTKVRAMLTFVTHINAQPCCLEVLVVSGSVRTCRNAMHKIQQPWYATVDINIQEADQSLILNIGH